METSEESIRLKIINKENISEKKRNYIKDLYDYEDSNQNLILIKNILIEYFGMESITKSQSKNFIKLSKLDIFKTNLDQLVLDIGIVLKIQDGLNLIKDNYKKNMYFESSGKCEFDELYEGFKIPKICKYN